MAISTQVINEFVAVSIKKNILSREKTFHYATEFMAVFELVIVEAETILRSFDLSSTLNYSTWDSLILAAALQAKAKFLYTEDMQHGQVVDGKLTIINPFNQ
jgi:predicted nucleic acid-binding protein